MTSAGQPSPDRWLRRTALVAGCLYLLTFVSSIPAVALLDPVTTLFGGFGHPPPPPPSSPCRSLWEFSLGGWLLVKVFRPSPVTVGLQRPGSAQHTHGIGD